MDGLLDAAIDEMGAPEDVEDVLLHVPPCDQGEGLRDIGYRIGGETHPAEELLFGVNRGRRVVKAIFISIREHAPFNTRHGGIAQDLGDPFPVGKRFPQSLRFDEEARLSQYGQCVINRTIPGGRLELPVNLIGIADIPSQRFENRVDERRLRVLFAQIPILEFADFRHRLLDRFSQPVGFLLAHASLFRRALLLSAVKDKLK